MRRYLRIESSPAKSESWGGMSIPSTNPCYLHNTQREEFKYVYAANGCQVSERDTVLQIGLAKKLTQGTDRTG
ncbi:MAG: hypothetical protein K0S84_1521 [Nitrososphaera sp.]|nr:hypothetical protein [Nitrososphaera sp.]